MKPFKQLDNSQMAKYTDATRWLLAAWSLWCNLPGVAEEVKRLRGVQSRDTIEGKE